ncbi:protein NRT1/ PTR FAMILY 5.4 [Humulus lupulus]|uniref:protein NRT1/ PTR FAMILY 5.4 n=1 Tax=Humulus lupulus TaxID=3486 RepID=UPI002B40F30F|nr:protein NRT1/ PTR FAMILY 5.4 [Humulus lupulus]
MDSSSVAPMKPDNNGQYDEDYTNKHLSTTSTSKKSSKGGWNAALFIIFVEVADRFAFYGLAGNLIMYLTNVLRQPMATAAKNVNLWVGVSSLFPILGALLADSFLGRFNTILLSSIIYLTGMVMLTISSSAISLHYRKALFFVSLYVLSVGEGGHKPCVQTFAADQFDEQTAEEKKAKSSFFNWWYLGIVAGATVAMILVIYIQDNISWTIGFGILAAVLAAALGLFLLGIKRYRNQVPVGSPLTTVAKVLVAAALKWRVGETRGIYYGNDVVVEGPVVDGQLGAPPLTPTNKFRFLNKATIIANLDELSECKTSWRLCSVTQVEEVKLVLRLIPIWLSCLMFNVVQAQLHTFFTKQGSTMVRSIGPHFLLPPASLQSFVGITILAAVPIYDKFFIPFARKFTGHPSGITILQRIGFGLFLSILNMVVSALVESKRIETASTHGLLDSPKSVVPIRVWWLLPQYMICGVSDAFAVVGLQELFYAEMPEGMRSLGAAAHISILGVGNFLSGGIISLVQVISSRYGHDQRWLGDNLNRSHLNYFYWVLAALSAINLGLYIWISNGFVYKDNHVEGHKIIKVKNERSKFHVDNGEV